SDQEKNSRRQPAPALRTIGATCRDEISTGQSCVALECNLAAVRSVNLRINSFHGQRPAHFHRSSRIHASRRDRARHETDLAALRDHGAIDTARKIQTFSLAVL